jgi:hypothetical protein
MTFIAQIFGHKKPKKRTTDLPDSNTQDGRKHNIEKSAKLASEVSSFQSPSSDNPSGSGAERADLGASVAPGEGSSIMALSKQSSSVARVALTFVDAHHAKSARRIFRSERSAHYLGLPDPKTLVVAKDELSWFLPRLKEEGLGDPISKEPVLMMGDLPRHELAHLRSRKISAASDEKIKNLLESAKVRQQKLKKDRLG